MFSKYTVQDVSKFPNYAWVKDPFKMKVRPIGLKATEFESYYLWKNGYISMFPESLCCLPETITVLLIGYIVI